MSVGSVQGFQPTGTVTVAASTTSASGVLASPQGDSVLVYNAGTTLAFVRMDAGPATAADMPVPPGARMMFAVTPYATAVSVVLASGSGNVYFSRGNGTSY